MKTVYHPTLPTSLEVPDDDVEEWAEAGWRKTPPKDSTAAATAADKASDDTKGSNA